MLELLGRLPLTLLAVVVLGSILLAGATTFPATVEIDLVFPRNDTYAPSALFPIVLAFQNPALVPLLDPANAVFDLVSANNSGNSGSTDLVDLTSINFSGSDPIYVYTYFKNLNVSDDGTAARYFIRWTIDDLKNCSLQPETMSPISFASRTHAVFFTIQNGTKPPDLVPATDSTTPPCSNTTNFAFNLTGTDNNTCAVLSDTQPLVAGNPCAAQLGSAAASSISAAITSRECSSFIPSKAVSCPPSPTASISTAPGRNRGYMGRIAVFGGFLAVLMIL